MEDESCARAHRHVHRIIPGGRTRGWSSYGGETRSKARSSWQGSIDGLMAAETAKPRPRSVIPVLPRDSWLGTRRRVLAAMLIHGVAAARDHVEGRSSSTTRAMMMFATIASCSTGSR